MTNQDKVPSEISYSNGGEAGEQRQWGVNIPDDAVAMKHTKLQLDIQPVSDELDAILHALDGMQDFDIEHVKASGDIPQYTDKSAEEIVTDYLSLVFQYFLRQVKEFWDDLRQDTEVDIVITIPTVGQPRL
jgi:hypothetical protein